MGGGRADGGAVAVAAERDEDPLLARTGGALEFLWYRVRRNYNPRTGAAYIGTRPRRGSVCSVCRKINALTEARYGLLPAPEVVRRPNRVLLGWASYFCLGQASPAYEAVDAHTSKRLRQWLCVGSTR